MSRVLETGVHIITYNYNKGIHDGVDVVDKSKGYHALCNIIAHSDGEVVSVRSDYKTNDKSGNSYGNYVKLKHNNGYYTLYAHMAYKSVKLKVGDKVKKNAVIGFMSDTGFAFGGHLHFEVRDTNDEKINPTSYLDADLPNNVVYTKGNYKTTDNMYVRSGAGLIYSIKLVKQLTVDGKKNATSSNPYSLAVYKKGTIYTALEIINNKYGVWARTPSGYVCIKGTSGTIYGVKCD